MSKTDNPPKIKTETKIEINTAKENSPKSIEEGADIEGSFSPNFAKIQGNFTQKTSNKFSSEPQKNTSATKMGGARKMGSAAKIEPPPGGDKKAAAGEKLQEQPKFQVQVEMSSSKTGPNPPTAGPKPTSAPPTPKKTSNDSGSGSNKPGSGSGSGAPGIGSGTGKQVPGSGSKTSGTGTGQIGTTAKTTKPMHNVYTFKIRVPKTTDGRISLVEDGVPKPMITIVGPIETPASEAFPEDTTPKKAEPVKRASSNSRV